jgi:arginine/serine-rich splicing factor 4/5/6
MSRVYIGRLARDVQERDIEKLFHNNGEISSILLKEGYGFVVRL